MVRSKCLFFNKFERIVFMQKFSKVLLAIGAVAVVGAGGYGYGVYSNHQPKKVVKSIKISSSKSSKKSSSSCSSSSSSSVSSSNSSVQSSNNSFYDSSNGTILGCSDIHQFVNKFGETPAAYLVDKKGYSVQQALKYISGLPNGRSFMSSGEIQDLNAGNNQTNQNNNNNNNQNANAANGPSMHQDASGNWEDQDGRVYEHFTPDQIASFYNNDN